MQRYCTHKGLLLKLVTDYSNVPAGTWATVNSTGTMNDKAWWLTVRWHPYKPIPTKFPREVMEYSLNLWESDLALFETVTVEEKQAIKWPHENYQFPQGRAYKQLSLPFPDE